MLKLYDQSLEQDVVHTTAFYEVSAANLEFSDDILTNTQNGTVFDVNEYSKFKYGSGDAAQHIADTLHDKIVFNRTQMLLEHGIDILDDFVIAPAAYRLVPTAAYAMTQRLLSALVETGFMPSCVIRLERGVYDGDYSALNEEERKLVTEQSAARLSLLFSEDIYNKNLFVIDDIKITGKNEDMVRAAIATSDRPPKSVTFCYGAIVDPSYAKQQPNVEHYINHRFVNSFERLAEVVSQQDFEVNMRVCKYILGPSKAPEDVAAFAKRIPLVTASSIIGAMITDGYHKLETNQPNFNAFVQGVREHKDAILLSNLATVALAEQ